MTDILVRQNPLSGGLETASLNIRKPNNLTTIQKNIVTYTTIFYNDLRRHAENCGG